MGTYDSSKYRVEPLARYLEKNYNCIKELLIECVGIKEDQLPSLANPKFYYGQQEKALKPTEEHLLGLIDHLAAKEHNLPETKVGTLRYQLFYGNKFERRQAAQKAKELLRNGYNSLANNSKRQYVFEGFSKPDLLIDTDECVILVEGKWTETKVTNSTTYIKGNDEQRNQMVRHIQGALNEYKGKKVIAFYIVDDRCKYKNQLRTSEMSELVDNETIKPNDDERGLIRDSYYGFTTWQEVSKAFESIHFKTKKEIAESIEKTGKH